VYVGKCVKKAWAWRPVGALSDPLISDEASVGTISLSVCTRNPSGFPQSEVDSFRAQTPAGAEFEIAEYDIRVTLKGTGRKVEDMARHDMLISALKQSVSSADKAVLSVKKQPTQVHTSRCGDK
jgi:hypothetical protein